MSGGHRILEHTADVGIEAWGETIARAFEQAAAGLAEILGAVTTREQSTVRLTASAGDREALLVDFLNELLLLHETQEVALARAEVTAITDTELEARVGVAPIEGETETTGVKAATYHRLEVHDATDGVHVRVYLDV